MKKTILSLLIGLGLLIPAVILAQPDLSVQVLMPSNGPTFSCPRILQDLRMGSVDVSANGNVSTLQDLLVGKGFLNLPFGVAKGYFGNLTQRALASFQASLGIYPASGYFGPITRARIQSIFCSTNPPITPPSDVKSPVINGVKAPTSLRTDQKGTWTVEATDPQNGSLKYSVDWGDSDYCLYNTSPRPCDMSSGASAANRAVAFQQSATFTHSYSRVGTYTQTFTVTNDRGAQAETKTTVQVNSLSTNSKPTLSSLSPNSGPIGARINIEGKGFTSTGNIIKFGNYMAATADLVQSADAVNGQGMLQFTIPESLSNCSEPGPCTDVYRGVEAGTVYDISVTNSNGTSNSLKLSVTYGYPR